MTNLHPLRVNIRLEGEGSLDWEICSNSNTDPTLSLTDLLFFYKVKEYNTELHYRILVINKKKEC